MKTKERNRILIISLTDEIGGAENLLRLIASHCVSCNYILDVVIFKKTGSNFWTGYGFKTQNLGVFIFKNIFRKREYMYSFSSQVYLNSLVGILNKLRILKINFTFARESTRVFSRFKGFKLIIYKFFYFLGYIYLNVIICQNDQMKVELLNNIYCKNTRKIVVIKNPIDVHKLNILSEEPCDLEDVQNSFLSVGRLIPEKGFDSLIRAYALNAQYLPKLYIVGKGSERDSLQMLINLLDLQDKIILLGHKNNPYPYMKFAKGCIVSSKIEGYPNVLNEMIYLNENVLSSFCVPEVRNLDFLVKSDIFKISEFSNAMLILNENAKNIIVEDTRSSYIDSLKPEFFFDRIFSVDKVF